LCYDLRSSHLRCSGSLRARSCRHAASERLPPPAVRAASHLPKCYQLTHKAFDLKGLQEARCGSADDAEVVPPEDYGCADDAEVVPPQESAGLRKRRRHGEETVMRFAEMALVSLMSSVQSTTRTSDRLR
jgi:hypothetical protein